LFILVKNILSLYVLQAGTYLIPLITTPYLACTLGVANFGVLGIATAIMGYVSLVTDWGFGFTATKEVASHATDAAALRKIYWNTVLAKALLCSCALLMFIAAVWAIPQWRQMGSILFVASLSLVTGIFSTAWFLQGLEKIVPMATISLVNRFLSVPMIFALVHSPEDVIVVVAIGAGLGTISTVISFFVANRAVALLPIHFDIKGACQQIKAGASIFLSTAGISLYTQSNIIMIGAVAGPIQAGLYNGAEKIQRAVIGLIGPVSSAVYPRINNLLVSNPKQSHQLMRITLIAQGLFALCLSAGMYLTADIGTRLLLGEQYLSAIPIIRCLAALPFLIGVSNVLGINMMFPFGMNNEVARITLASGVFNVAMLPLLTYFLGAIGAAISIVLTETFVTVSMAWVIYANRHVVFKTHQARVSLEHDE
jgi:O-antigen/teichoic acid export membrane protein